MKNNFNRRDSHGHRGSKPRELAQHPHSRGSHAVTHTLHQHSYNHVVRSSGSAIIFQCMLGRNPPNSDMDYRIFNMRMCSFLCLRIHTGVGHIDSESTQHILTRKAHNFCVCSWRDSNLCPLDLESDAVQIEPPRHRYAYIWQWIYFHFCVCSFFSCYCSFCIDEAVCV